MMIKIAARPNTAPSAPPSTVRVFDLELPPLAAATGVDDDADDAVAMGAITDTDGNEDVVCSGVCAPPPRTAVAFNHEFSLESNISMGLAEFPPVMT